MRHIVCPHEGQIEALTLKTKVFHIIMSLMKRRILLTFLILAVAAVMLASCSGGERGSGGNDDGSRKLRIVTTIFPQYDFTRQIAGDLADVKMLLKQV